MTQASNACCGSHHQMEDREQFGLQSDFEEQQRNIVWSNWPAILGNCIPDAL
jgi:hypothetical protein